jgi:Ran GTPase-activating protein (RanGAP) involved in mRNA processing and transport
MYNQTLTSLDLRGNALGNDGAIILARGLRAMENTKLQELDLGYNEIKDDGACTIAQVGASNNV